ncbi:SAM-dependent methyltransferase [Sorangium cellulosum]|uniref:SAM-dependent methyltransferase n=1 Tax=Sorangium cellulosum TaxID=56 RepID=A0A2L0EPB8_SORCE|nr:methyltransferase domain-containing protein [Sorangium cellulosum]AUX41139.1 SAM-dependent methyltransferase [Sorangium cellulosum]
MGNEFVEHPSHSAEYFGDTRDNWWNPDYVALLARRWRLDQVREVLDVGCGVGHWGRVLGGVLPGEARITGVDRDPFWVAKAAERAAARGEAERFRYQVGVAEQLPFERDRFDLVTCQTVLIHAADPGVMLADMIRVVKPGGLVAVAEPNNVADTLLNAAMVHAPVDQVLALVHMQLLCERGKAALGEGHNSIGELLPALFAERGLTDIQVHLNDKASLVLPPYTSAEQRATVEEISDFARREFWIWSRADTLRYFIAGGGEERSFEGAWAAAMAASRRRAEAIAEGTYSSAGGAITYLVSGRKAAASSGGA